MRSGTTVVGHLLLPLMNSFNKTEAAVFPYRGYAFLGLTVLSDLNWHQSK